LCQRFFFSSPSVFRHFCISTPGNKAAEWTNPNKDFNFHFVVRSLAAVLECRLQNRREKKFTKLLSGIWEYIDFSSSAWCRKWIGSDREQIRHTVRRINSTHIHTQRHGYRNSFWSQIKNIFSSNKYFSSSNYFPYFSFQSIENVSTNGFIFTL
jgi:hypothetical protein